LIKGRYISDLVYVFIPFLFYELGIEKLVERAEVLKEALNFL